MKNKNEIQKDMLYCIFYLLLSIGILLSVLLDVLCVVPGLLCDGIIFACIITFWIVFCISEKNIKTIDE